jgi:hypothetical protein
MEWFLATTSIWPLISASKPPDSATKSADFGPKLTHGCVTCGASVDFRQLQRFSDFPANFRGFRISPRISQVPRCVTAGAKPPDFGRKTDADVRHHAPQMRHLGPRTAGRARPTFRPFTEFARPEQLDLKRPWLRHSYLDDSCSGACSTKEHRGGRRVADSFLAPRHRPAPKPGQGPVRLGVTSRRWPCSLSIARREGAWTRSPF